MLGNYLGALHSYLRNPSHFIRAIRWWRPDQPSPENHIFVVGAPRSGTSLMRTILTSHPDLCGYSGESGLFTWKDIFKEQRRFFGFDKSTQRKLLDEAEDVVQFLDRAAEVVKHRSGGERFVEKTPQHVLYLSFLTTYFPKAKVVNMQRDGRDCFCSARAATIPHADGLKRFAWYWRRCINARSKVQSGRNIFNVKYEDLTSRPKATVKQVMGFLEEPFDRRQLAVESRIEDRRSNFEHLRKLARPIDAENQERWRDELSIREVTIFQRIAGKQLACLGYPLL